MGAAVIHLYGTPALWGIAAAGWLLVWGLW